MLSQPGPLGLFAAPEARRHRPRHPLTLALLTGPLNQVEQVGQVDQVEQVQPPRALTDNALYIA